MSNKGHTTPKIESARLALPPIVLSLLLFFLPGCDHNVRRSGHEAESFQRKADEFIDNGAEFLGDRIVNSKADVISKLGTPLKVTSKGVRNIYSEVMDTVYELFYEGLYLEIYEVTLDNRSFVYHIVVTSKKYKSKWDLGVGATKEDLRAILGKPDQSDIHSWSYVALYGHLDSVRFYFEKDTVRKIEWSYVVD